MMHHIPMDLHDFHNEWVTLVEKASVNYQSLTPPERVWFSTQLLIAGVDNGGLISLYYNSFADTLEEALRDLEVLEAFDVRELLLKVNELFPGNMPSRSCEVRNLCIDSWPDDGRYDDLLNTLDTQFYELESELERKLLEYMFLNNLVSVYS